MAKILSTTDKQTLRAFWRAMLAHKKDLWLTNVNLISWLSIYIVAPFATSNLIATLVDPAAPVKPYLVMLVVASIVGVVSNRIGFSALMRLVAKTASDLQAQVMDMLMKRGVGFHADNVSGKIVSDAIDYPRSFQQISVALFVDTVPFLVTIVAGITIIALNSLALGFIMFAMSVLIVAWAWWQSQVRSEIRTKRHAAQKTVTAHIGDSITNVMTVKSFAREDKEMATHLKLNETVRKLRERDWVDVAIDGSNRHAALMTIQLIFVGYLIYMTSKNPESLSIGIFAFSYSISMTNRLFQINQIIRTVDEGLVEAAPMTEYLAQDIEIVDSKDASQMAVDKGVVAFNGVDFSYKDDDQSTSVFNDFTLGISQGERIGLVGPSGGGKTTFMKLLLRFSDPDDGTITIDDQDICKVTQKSLRQNISYVSQEPLLFHRTIRENICYGVDRSVDESELKQVARQAQALEFIDDLPSGFETVVGERGVKLSGGQRQRIAIARAMLKDSPILLLDEATSALDSESEKYIQSALHQLMKGKTVIVIAHRLSTINELDRIIVIDDGKITEQGSHEELLKNNSLYARLWNHQSGGFIND